MTIKFTSRQIHTDDTDRAQHELNYALEHLLEETVGCNQMSNTDAAVRHIRLALRSLGQN